MDGDENFFGESEKKCQREKSRSERETGGTYVGVLRRGRDNPKGKLQELAVLRTVESSCYLFKPVFSTEIQIVKSNFADLKTILQH